MNTKLSILTAVTLSAFASGAQAGAVADADIVTFTPNTTAKAAEVNQNFTNLKNAVNDNNTRITANSSDITALLATLQNRFGGDGSGGNLLVNAATNFNNTPPTNPFFNNITIESGQMLLVPAGTTLRCAGNFTNNGTLYVYPGAEAHGTFTLGSGPAPSVGVTSIPHPGDTPGAASMGQFDNSPTVAAPLHGGTGGKFIPKAVAVTSFDDFKFGGGSGAGYDNQGNRGGGLVKIYCNGTVTNNGLIDARGESATNTSIGGGGGGIVVLASRTQVNNSLGTINVNGGNASTSDYTFAGNAGGGGGGIVVLVSPTAPVPGTLLFSGGTGATGTATVTMTLGRSAGAGGGGSGGYGGTGGEVSIAGAKSVGGNGQTGYTLELTVDPVALVR